jgi:hypothetical protein
MSYLRGSGTESDPFVIHNAAAFKYFLETDGHFSTDNSDYTVRKYFDVVSNIDMGGVSCTSKNLRPICCLNLNGHRVFNFTLNAGISLFYPYSSGVSGWNSTRKPTIKNGGLSLTYLGSQFFYPAGGVEYKSIELTDLVIDAGKTLIAGRQDLQYHVLSRVVFVRPMTGYLPDGVGCSIKDCYAKGATDKCIDVSLAPYYPGSYPALQAKPETWIMDGVSLPTTIPNGRADLTTGYAIKGVTRVGNSRKSRDVAILSAAYRLPVWSGKSDAEGKFFAPLYDYHDAVIPVIFDDYGYPLKKDTNYVVGDVIHPSTPNGYRYICEQVGTSGPTLPAEPWSVEVLLTAGTAKFRPYPVYEPKCLGPIYPGKANLVTGEKV